MGNGELILVICRTFQVERALLSVPALPHLHSLNCTHARARPARRSVDPASSTPARSMKPSWEAERIIPVILSFVGSRVDELGEGEVGEELQLVQTGRREH
jgi:hypothetical protein